MSVGPWQLVLVLLIVLVIFGSKKLGNIGSDLGKAIRGFKKGMDEDKDKDNPEAQARNTQADDAPGAADSDAPKASARHPESDSDASSRKPPDSHKPSAR